MCIAAFRIYRSCQKGWQQTIQISDGAKVDFFFFTLLNIYGVWWMMMNQYRPNTIKSSSFRTWTCLSPMNLSLPSLFTISINSILLETGRGVYGKLKTGGLITPNYASAVLRHIGFGSANNHWISGISFAFRVGLLSWNIGLAHELDLEWGWLFTTDITPSSIMTFQDPTKQLIQNKRQYHLKMYFHNMDWYAKPCSFVRTDRFSCGVATRVSNHFD